MNLTVHLYLHGDADEQRTLIRIERAIAEVLKQGNLNMTKIVDDIKAVVAEVAAAVNTLEAKITEVLANSGMSAEDKAGLEEALAGLKAAVADAADGVDEAAPTP